MAGLLSVPSHGRRAYLVDSTARALERLCYRAAGVDPEGEQTWKGYSLALLSLTAISLAALFAILVLQGQLPLNPLQLPGLEWHLALNTAVSFVTNTNWQAYSGEAQLSYFSQMLGLGVQNFVSPAVGLAVLVVSAVLGASLCQRHRQFLGRYDPCRPLLFAAAQPGTGIVAGVAGRSAEPDRLCSGIDATGRRTDDPARAGGQPDRNQAAGDQRRWLLRRQFGSPFENPTA